MPRIPRAMRTEKPVRRIELTKISPAGAGAAALTAAGMGQQIVELGKDLRKKELQAEAADRAMKLSLIQRDLYDKADELETDPDVLGSTGDRHEGLYTEKLDNYAQDVADNIEDPILRDEFFKLYDQVGVKYRARARTEAHAKRVDHIATGLIELENRLTNAAVKNPNKLDDYTLELAAAYNAQVKSGMLTEKYAEGRNNAWVDATITDIEQNQENIAWTKAAADPESFLAHTDWIVDEDDRWVRQNKEGVLVTKEREVLDRQKDKNSYQAFGKKGYAWLYNKDPDQVLRIRTWAMRKILARKQGRSTGTSLLTMRQNDTLASIAKDGKPIDDPNITGEQPYKPGNYWRQQGKEDKAYIYDNILEPAAYKYYSTMNTPHENGKENDDGSPMIVDFDYIPFAEQRRIINEEMNPSKEEGLNEEGFSLREKQHKEVLRMIDANESLAIKDPRRYVNSGVLDILKKSGVDNVDPLSPEALDLSIRLQEGMKLTNRKLLSKGYVDGFKNRYKAVNGQEKVNMLAEIKQRTGNYWPQISKELEVDTLDILAVSGDYAPEEARDLVDLNTLDENDIPLKDEKDKRSIRETVDSRFHRSNLGQALIGQVGIHQGNNRALAIKNIDNLRSGIYKMAMRERMKGAREGAAVDKAIAYFEERYSYLVDDENFFLILPKGVDAGIIRDGLNYVRENIISSEMAWVEEEIVKLKDNEFFQVLGEAHVNNARNNGVWVNVPGSENRVYMLIDPQTQLPVRRKDGAVYTLTIKDAMELGKTYKEESRVGLEEFTF